MLRLSILFAASAAIAAAQQHEHGAAGTEKLGTVRFATSCSARAQPPFNRAVALLHSFDFARAVAGFDATLAADASCTIAHWGIALSRWGNPFAPGAKAAAQLQQGREAIDRATASPPKSDREQAYVDAASRLYADYEHAPQGTRVLAYRDAMERLAARYPDDTEASIFYALSLAIAADPADKTYASQLKSGAILQKLFVKQPDHPGLAHYIIHSYDVPPLADRALEAARVYSRIAPSAPHALHMPSHTFTRVGDWQESIAANIAAARSAKSEGAVSEELHASDYQTYAYLQTGQDRAARGVVESLPEIYGRFNPTAIGAGGAPAAGYFAVAAIPARYALERGDWKQAASLEPRPSPLPYTGAMTYFARALGAARVKDPATIRASIEALQQARDRLADAKEVYWAEQVEIQRLGAEAWLALVEGRNRDAIAGMRTAADREDAIEKSAVTPGPLAPARELLGEMLLQTNDPAQALKEFEGTLRKEPNRFRAVAGAAKAAAASGNRAAARKYYERLLKICVKGDEPGRAELQEARRIAGPTRGSAPTPNVKR
ncbi:MAG TPA: hypothetical protein VGQ16_02105 [Vicinamibacterales bacterium]|nr:hypothetical protein [Vicinamibacterales bacterium]